MLLLAAILASAVPAAEETAIFRAAGFSRAGGVWKSGNCNGLESASYSPGTIDTYRDVNGDGRPEAVVMEGGAICYGNTAAHFWLLSRQSNGRWTRLFDSLGLPQFLTTRGVERMPDIEVGGPGFCFGVVRWNGKAYVHNRFQYEGKPCRPPR